MARKTESKKRKYPSEINTIPVRIPARLNHEVRQLHSWQALHSPPNSAIPSQKQLREEALKIGLEALRRRYGMTAYKSTGTESANRT